MTQQEESLLARLPVYRNKAVGQRFTVRHNDNKNMKSEGVITDVQFGRFSYTARSITMVFKITMECGTNKVPREFFVSRLPA